MKSVAENHAANLFDTDGGADRSSEGLMLATFGADLRSCYADLTQADQPRSLLDLAETIDASLAGRSPQE